MGKRDTSRDGFPNKLQEYALTHFGPVWQWVQSRDGLRRKANKLIIDTEVGKIPTRPNPFSTRSPYSSWDSLIDRTYSGLHLPPLDSEPVTGDDVSGISFTPAATFEKNLPPEEDLEMLFRQEEQLYSPKSNILFPYFVNWFTDGFLRTDRHDPRKNTSNHHIDLCTVYGLHPEMTAQLRSMDGGRMKSQMINGEEYPPFYYDDHGLPKPEFDTLLRIPETEAPVPPEKKRTLFALGVEVERANLVPSYVALNVLCLREHNRLAGLLAEAYPKWDDERLFQTARNVVIVEIIKLVVEDYINHIHPNHFQMIFDPPTFKDSSWLRQNWMSVEFSLVYRWHSMLPSTFLHKGERMTMESSLWDNMMLTELGLGAFLEESSTQPAGMLSLFNTPDFLVPVEMTGVHLGRAAKLRSYNDYREFFKFPRVTSFDQITGDRRRIKELKRLYKHPDNLELYVGLYSEDVHKNAAIPPLVGRMIGIDAFTQALTNPLIAGNLFNKETFTPLGWDEIMNLKSVSQLTHRNLPAGRQHTISFYRKDWKR